MSLVEHAKRELNILGGLDCEVQQWMYKHLIYMVEEFSKEGHSGFSANYASNLLSKLLQYKPLTDLKGTDDEWIEVSKGLYQNIRCSHVFKENGKSYDIEGKVFREPNGCCFTNGDSRVYIEFPYYPKTEYVDVQQSEES